MSDLTPTTRVVQNLRKRGVTVYTHAQWGSTSSATYAARKARTRAGGYGRFVAKADTVVQHITVTTPSGDVKADARVVERIGNERFGCGVSYNWLVDMKTGEVCVGQPLDSKGVHTINDKGIKGWSKDQNLVARAIAVIGQPSTPLSDKAQDSITAILSAMVDEGQITAGFDYKPHSFFAWKDCPCAPTRDRMPAIRKAVGSSKSAGGSNARPAAKKPTHGKRLDKALQRFKQAYRILSKAKGKGNRQEAIAAAKAAAQAGNRAIKSTDELER